MKPVVFCLLLSIGWCAQTCARAEERDPDLRAQIKVLQDQMHSMTQVVDSQKKKLEDQDKTIARLQSGSGAIAPSVADEALQKANGKYGKGAVNDPEPEPKKSGEHVRSWEQPPVVVEVVGEKESQSTLREEDLIGPYKQPRWTARRRFAETRTYVIPEGQFQFEYWSIVKTPRKGDTKVETKYEVEIGLPSRFQLDLYAISHEESNQGKFGFDEQDVELRFAFADWDVIPGNPTAYAEWKFLNEEPDHCEFKLLFGGQAAPRWHWSANAVFEHQAGGDQVNAYELTGAMSYTVKDEKLSIGAEVKLAFEDDKFDRGLHKPELLVGPSIQYRPLKQMHVDFVPLLGLTEQSNRFKSLLIVGWEF